MNNLEIQSYTLTLNDADLQVIQQALDNVIFKYAAPLVNKISAQLQAQTQTPVAPVAPVVHVVAEAPATVV